MPGSNEYQTGVLVAAAVAVVVSLPPCAAGKKCDAANLLDWVSSPVPVDNLHAPRYSDSSSLEAYNFSKPPTGWLNLNATACNPQTETSPGAWPFAEPGIPPLTGPTMILCQTTSRWEFCKQLGCNLTGEAPGWPEGTVAGRNNKDADIVHAPGLIEGLSNECLYPSPDPSAAAQALLKLFKKLSGGCSVNGIDNLFRTVLGVSFTELSSVEGGLIYIIDASRWPAGGASGTALADLFPYVMALILQDQMFAVAGRSIGAAVLHQCDEWLAAAAGATHPSGSSIEMELVAVQLDYSFELEGGATPQCSKHLKGTDFAHICTQALQHAAGAQILPPFLTVVCTTDCVAAASQSQGQPQLFVSAKILFTGASPLTMPKVVYGAAAALAAKLLAAKQPVVTLSGEQTGALFHASTTTAAPPVALKKHRIQRFQKRLKNLTTTAVFPVTKGLDALFCAAEPSKCVQPAPRSGAPDGGWPAWKIGAVVAVAVALIGAGFIGGRGRTTSGAADELASTLLPDGAGGGAGVYEDDMNQSQA